MRNPGCILGKPLEEISECSPESVKNSSRHTGRHSVEISDETLGANTENPPNGMLGKSFEKIQNKNSRKPRGKAPLKNSRKNS